MLDGLGRRLLDAHAEVAPTLAAASGTTLDATFPAATATNLASLATGRHPIEHGLTGSFLAPGDASRVMSALTWTWDAMDGPDARDSVVPEQLQPVEPRFTAARAAGMAVTTVLHPAFVGSGLTRAALRGAQVATAGDLTTALGDATRALHDGPGLVYVHHATIDSMGHVHGPGSGAWRAALAEADRTIAAVLPTLPDDVALVVTADHGMVAIAEDGFIDLADEPTLAHGVRVLAGDPRAVQLHVGPGHMHAVARRWRDHVADRGVVLTRDDAVAAGLFGPPTRASEHAVAAIGDLLVLPTEPIAWIHRHRDPFGGRLPGQHAAPTDDELAVPVVVLRGG